MTAPENNPEPTGKQEQPADHADDNAQKTNEDQQTSESDQQPVTSEAGNEEPSFVPEQEEDPGPTLLQLPTENMEIHHHAHGHHRKRWKNYLYEFLMLFLAVTAGFFVENTRESYIEHHRANQFSKQVLADLRLDSIMFEDRNRRISNMQVGHDSLLYLLTKKVMRVPGKFWKRCFPITFVFDVPATTTTYNQMKSSGSLRYIGNTELTSHLQHYYDVLLPAASSLQTHLLPIFLRT